MHALARLATRDELRIPEKREHRAQVFRLRGRSEEPSGVAHPAGERIVRRFQHRDGLRSTPQRAHRFVRFWEPDDEPLAPRMHFAREFGSHHLSPRAIPIRRHRDRRAGARRVTVGEAAERRHIEHPAAGARRRQSFDFAHRPLDRAHVEARQDGARLGDRDHRPDLAAQRALKQRQRLQAGLVHIDMRMRLVADDDIGDPGDRRVEVRVQIEAHCERLRAERGARGADQLEIRAQRARADEGAMQREIQRIRLCAAHAIDDFAHHGLQIRFLHWTAGSRGGAAQENRGQSPISGEEIDRRADLGVRASIKPGARLAREPLALLEMCKARRHRRERVSLVPQSRDGDAEAHERFVIMRARS